MHSIPVIGRGTKLSTMHSQVERKVETGLAGQRGEVGESWEWVKLGEFLPRL